MYSAVEVFAALFAIMGLTKIVVVVVNRKRWRPVALGIYGNARISSCFFAVLAIVVFYFLIQELSIVQIFAVMLFSSLMIGLSLLQYSDEMTSLIKEVFEKKFSVAQKVLIFVWIVLQLWVLKSVFF